jgi:hypothetical protein
MFPLVMNPARGRQTGSVAIAIVLLAVVGTAHGGALPQADAVWYASAEALGLQLDGGARDNTPIVIDSLTDAPLLSTGDVNYPMAVGPRLTLGRTVGDCHAFEMVYFGLQQWDTSRTVTGDNDLAIPGALGLASLDFFNVDELTASNRASLNNVEANLWRRLGGGSFCVMAGFRYLDLDERFVIQGADSDTGASRYRIGTQNDLFGGQVGGRYRRCFGPGSLFGVEAVGKAGVFGNAASSSQLVTDFDNTSSLRDVSTSAGQAAFVGDIGLTALLRLTDSLQFRIGYTMIWVEGIARSANQLDFTDDADSGRFVHFGDGAFLQGINVGFEYGF